MNKYWLGAGFINIVASIAHIIIGYYNPLSPLMQTQLNDVAIATILAVWIMYTLVMLCSSFILLWIGSRPNTQSNNTLATLFGFLYLAFGLIFLCINVYYDFFSLLQWLLLLPIGGLTLYGRK